MAKGNIFLGDASGRVGSIVLSTRAGEMITRKYQANVKNPKSTAQMVQRARFAAAVKFYKHANQAFFPFAYEDKKKTESDFNAFMRHNLLNDNVIVLNKELVDGTFPSLAKSWLLTEGRIGGGVYLRPEYKEGEKSYRYLGVYFDNDHSQTISPDDPDKTWTVAEFSKTMLDNDSTLQEGDIVTSVLVSADVTDVADGNPDNYPLWQIRQFRLSLSDNRDVTTLSFLSIDSNLSQTVVFGYGSSDNETLWGAMVITRKNSDGSLYATTTALACTDPDLNNSALVDYNKAVASWNPSGTAILKGGLSSELNVISPAAGSSITVESGKGISVVGTGLGQLTKSDFVCSTGVSITSFIATTDGTSLSIIFSATADGTITYKGGASSGGITWLVSKTTA